MTTLYSDCGFLPWLTFIGIGKERIQADLEDICGEGTQLTNNKCEAVVTCGPRTVLDAGVCHPGVCRRDGSTMVTGVVCQSFDGDEDSCTLDDKCVYLPSGTCTEKCPTLTTRDECNAQAECAFVKH